jgi:hypothetical protein
MQPHRDKGMGCSSSSTRCLNVLDPWCLGALVVQIKDGIFFNATDGYATT